MHAPSDSLQRLPGLAHPLAFQMSLAALQLNHLLALAQWTTTLWAVGENQCSRLCTLINGGAPIGA